MRTFIIVTCIAALAIAQDDSKAKREHIIVTPDDVQWTDGPSSVPPGAKMSVLEGDPKKEGFFLMRLKLPAGYTIAPHWHAGDERVTVISGSFQIGLGDTYDQAKMKTLPIGGYFSFPPKSTHFAHVTEDTVIQLSTIGPWSLTYVNPADDPRTKK